MEPIRDNMGRTVSLHAGPGAVPSTISRQRSSDLARRNEEAMRRAERNRDEKRKRDNDQSPSNKKEKMEN